MQSEHTNTNRSRQMDIVPPLVQIVKNINELINSPINTLNNSIVSSQYIFDNNFQKAAQSNSKLLNKPLRNTKILNNNSYNKKTQSNDLSNKKSQRSQIHYQAQQLQKYQAISQRSYKHVIQLQPILNDSSFQRAQQPSFQQNNKSSESKKSQNKDLFYQSCQIMKNMINLQRSSLETQWFNSQPKDILCTIMTNPSKLTFYLKNIQNQIIQSRDPQVKKNLELLSCMIIKLLNRRNRSNQRIKPEVYLYEEGMRIDFQPSNDTKAKQLKIEQLRQINITKQKQIQKVRKQYDQIVHNLAKTIENINENHNHRASVSQKSKKSISNTSLKLMRKATFGFNQQPSNSSKDEDYQYM